LLRLVEVDDHQLLTLTRKLIILLLLLHRQLPLPLLGIGLVVASSKGRVRSHSRLLLTHSVNHRGHLVEIDGGGEGNLVSQDKRRSLQNGGLSFGSSGMGSVDHRLSICISAATIPFTGLLRLAPLVQRTSSLLLNNLITKVWAFHFGLVLHL